MQAMVSQAKKISAFFYCYSVFFDEFATATTVTASVNIQADSNFLVQQMMFACQNAAAAVVAPAINIQVTDASSGMTLFDRALPVWSVAGTPQLPYLLPTPRTFPASSSIQVTASSTDGGTRDLYILFAGQKVSRLGG